MYLTHAWRNKVETSTVNLTKRKSLSNWRESLKQKSHRVWTTGNHAAKSRRVQEFAGAARNPTCSGAIKHLTLIIHRQAHKVDRKNTTA